jgi:hypothetical protein
MVTLLADAIGWAGAACLLLAYARLSSRRLAVGVRYHLLNLAGAGGLAVNGAFHHAWPSTALNLVWLGIGLTALHRTKRAGSGPQRHIPPQPPIIEPLRSAHAIRDCRWMDAARSVGRLAALLPACPVICDKGAAHICR